MRAIKIVDVPEKMEKFYGKGRMLHPDIEMVEELIKHIPKGKVVTIDAICKRLSNKYGTDVACPMRTGNAIKKLSVSYKEDENTQSAPFWRVIKNDKFLVKTDSIEEVIAKLEDEGITLLYKNEKSIKVLIEEGDFFEFE